MARKEDWLGSGCVLRGAGAIPENEAEGGGRTGMGRQGPRPDVLTQENCRKVTRSVEDAEIKTSVLKQNSALLEVRVRVWWAPKLVRRLVASRDGGWRSWGWQV